MSNTVAESVVDTQTNTGPLQDTATATPSSPYTEQPLKLKGRQRMLAGLKRISSSQSLARLSTTRSRAYSGNGRGSVSCMSLPSTQSLNTPSLATSLTQELSAGYSTAPTSAVSTPGVQLPLFDERARVRYLSTLDGKTSAAVPTDYRPATRSGLTPGIPEVNEDYFSRPVSKPQQKTRDFNFWRDLPSELKMEVLTYLEPRAIVRCSLVSKSWHKMCFDGQLWSILDTADFYQDIPAGALVKIITSAGPFVRDLNLRGCVQLRERWHAKGLSDACTNLENFSLEGCRIDRSSIHNFLYSNTRLVHVNLSGLAGATNFSMKIIAANCPKLQHLNVSWCNNIDARGLKKVVDACPDLKDLRAGEVRGWDDLDLMQDLFVHNSLERLILMNCDSLTDESLTTLIEGRDSEVDFLTGRAIVPPRKLKHLDLTRCRGITDQGLRSFVNNLPEIEGLQLSKCHGVMDATLTDLFPTTPLLSHLDLEELEDLTNDTLLCLAHSPCSKRLRHLSVSYCEHIGDTGMIPLLKACTNLRSLEMDNTRISDLVLAEAAAMMRRRTPRTLVQGGKLVGAAVATGTGTGFRPATGLRLVAYDCQNVTWTGVREVLSRNAEVFVSTHTAELPPLDRQQRSHPPSSPSSSSSSAVSSSTDVHLPHPSSPPTPTTTPPTAPTPPRLHITRTTSYPTEIIQLKCFYTFQPTVEEHTKRVLRGDFLAARRLERKWAEFMMAQEEAGAAGAGGRRRRARSGGCAVM
ncbi:hypothetical protein LTR65_007968 [Meristemomyces frigidus]